MQRRVHFRYEGLDNLQHHPIFHLYPIISLRSAIAARRLRHKLYEPWPFTNPSKTPCRLPLLTGDSNEYLAFKKREYARLVKEVIDVAKEPLIEARVTAAVRDAIEFDLTDADGNLLGPPPSPAPPVAQESMKPGKEKKGFWE
ncbi:MAG: hypothetical protein M1835_005881, partial [Candelina submexicana]